MQASSPSLPICNTPLSPCPIFWKYPFLSFSTYWKSTHIFHQLFLLLHLPNRWIHEWTSLIWQRQSGRHIDLNGQLINVRYRKSLEYGVNTAQRNVMFLHMFIDCTKTLWNIIGWLFTSPWRNWKLLWCFLVTFYFCLNLW